jgi:hypothetical protein
MQRHLNRAGVWAHIAFGLGIGMLAVGLDSDPLQQPWFW